MINLRKSNFNYNNLIRILLVEDDVAINAMLKTYLEGKQYVIEQALDAEQALATLRKSNPELIILDWMLPDTSGPELLKTIRSNPLQKNIPVIIITSRAQKDDKIMGLEYGANDHMTKPILLKELHARIKALLRKSHRLEDNASFVKGNICLNIQTNELLIKGKVVAMGKTELGLLRYLMRTAGQAHSRATLLDQVWGQGVFIEERTVDVHILRLRKILKAHGVDNTVQTVRGVGYRFTE